MNRLAGIFHARTGTNSAGEDAMNSMLDAMNQQSGLEKQLLRKPSFEAGLLARPDRQSDGLYHNVQSGEIILFDGSIYNRREVAQKLGLPTAELPGEASLFFHAFRAWGADCLHQFNGRWAIVRFHPMEGIWAARDRFGVKPLYYASQQNEWLFASEQKAFLAHPTFQTQLNPVAVYDFFLRNKAGNAPQDLLQHVSQLMPAELIRINPAGEMLELKTWYKLKYLPKTTAFNHLKSLEYQEDIGQKLQENIRLRLERHSTNNLANFLSGGLDSSMLSALIGEQKSAVAITAVYPGQPISEESWAAKVVRHLGLSWNKVSPDLENIRSDWKAFYYSQDVPTYSFGTFNQYALFQKSAELGVQAVFDGQAADSLFAGHDFYLPAFWRELWRSGQFKALKSELQAYGGIRKSGKYFLKNYLKYVVLPKRRAGQIEWLQRMYDPRLAFFQSDFLEAHRSRLSLDKGDHLRSVNAMLHEEFIEGDILGLLKCLDRAASWFGVETITPFADDPELIESVFRMPSVYKIRQNQSKFILREIAAKKLPRDVVYRTDKMGLVAPNNLWLEALKDEMRVHFEELDPAIFDRTQLLANYDQFFQFEKPQENYRVYKFMAFTLWLASVKHYTGRAL
ncbi:MAG: hypothetical protein KDC34_00455 [Saprospiraceae bacterium]|nr:hypothetical protein [Saprospiraceae bacterium]